MRGRLKCLACGHEFEIKQATFTFDLSSKGDGTKEMNCPSCNSTDIVPVFESRIKKE
nr:hypothetical protein [Candidatus Sigynarchaeota archaeon]